MDFKPFFLPRLRAAAVKRFGDAGFNVSMTMVDAVFGTSAMMVPAFLVIGVGVTLITGSGLALGGLLAAIFLAIAILSAVLGLLMLPQEEEEGADQPSTADLEAMIIQREVLRAELAKEHNGIQFMIRDAPKVFPMGSDTYEAYLAGLKVADNVVVKLIKTMDG